MGKQNLKKIRPIKGEGRTEHGEKKDKLNVSLTPSCKEGFKNAADKLGISVTELLQRIGGKGEAWLIDAVKECEFNSDDRCVIVGGGYQGFAARVIATRQFVDSVVEIELLDEDIRQGSGYKHPATTVHPRWLKKIPTTSANDGIPTDKQNP